MALRASVGARARRTLANPVLGGFLGLVGTILGVGGIGQAITASKDADTAAEKQIKALQSIEQTMTTRMIGTFPAVLGPITRLVDDAKLTLDIATDYPGYGLWSATIAYQNYAAAMAQHGRREKPTPVRLIFNTQERWTWAENIQFSDQAFAEHANDAEFKSRLLLVKERFNLELPGRPTRDQFLAGMRTVQEKEIQKFPKAFDLKRLNEFMALHVWIADAEGSDGSTPHAIFVVPGPGERGHGIGYETLDRGLVLALKGIFDAYEDQAQKRAFIGSEP